MIFPDAPESIRNTDFEIALPFTASVQKDPAANSKRLVFKDGTVSTVLFGNFVKAVSSKVTLTAIERWNYSPLCEYLAANTGVPVRVILREGEEIFGAGDGFGSKTVLFNSVYPKGETAYPTFSLEFEATIDSPVPPERPRAMDFLVEFETNAIGVHASAASFSEFPALVPASGSVLVHLRNDSASPADNGRVFEVYSDTRYVDRTPAICGGAARIPLSRQVSDADLSLNFLADRMRYSMFSDERPSDLGSPFQEGHGIATDSFYPESFKAGRLAEEGITFQDKNIDISEGYGVENLEGFKVALANADRFHLKALSNNLTGARATVYVVMSVGGVRCAFRHASGLVIGASIGHDVIECEVEPSLLLDFDRQVPSKLTSEVWDFGTSGSVTEGEAHLITFGKWHHARLQKIMATEDEWSSPDKRVSVVPAVITRPPPGQDVTSVDFAGNGTLEQRTVVKCRIDCADLSAESGGSFSGDDLAAYVMSQSSAPAGWDADSSARRAFVEVLSSYGKSGVTGTSDRAVLDEGERMHVIRLSREDGPSGPGTVLVLWLDITNTQYGGYEGGMDDGDPESAWSTEPYVVRFIRKDIVLALDWKPVFGMTDPSAAVFSAPDLKLFTYDSDKKSYSEAPSSMFDVYTHKEADRAVLRLRPDAVKGQDGKAWSRTPLKETSADGGWVALPFGARVYAATFGAYAAGPVVEVPVGGYWSILASGWANACDKCSPSLDGDARGADYDFAYGRSGLYVAEFDMPFSGVSQATWVIKAPAFDRYRRPQMSNLGRWAEIRRGGRDCEAVPMYGGHTFQDSFTGSLDPMGNYEAAVPMRNPETLLRSAAWANSYFRGQPYKWCPIAVRKLPVLMSQDGAKGEVTSSGIALGSGFGLGARGNLAVPFMASRFDAPSDGASYELAAVSTPLSAEDVAVELECVSRVIRPGESQARYPWSWAVGTFSVRVPQGSGNTGALPGAKWILGKYNGDWLVQPPQNPADLSGQIVYNDPINHPRGELRSALVPMSASNPAHASGILVKRSINGTESFETRPLTVPGFHWSNYQAVLDYPMSRDSVLALKGASDVSLFLSQAVRFAAYAPSGSGFRKPGAPLQASANSDSGIGWGVPCPSIRMAVVARHSVPSLSRVIFEDVFTMARAKKSGDAFSELGAVDGWFCFYNLPYVVPGSAKNGIDKMADYSAESSPLFMLAPLDDLADDRFTSRLGLAPAIADVPDDTDHRWWEYSRPPATPAHVFAGSDLIKLPDELFNEQASWWEGVQSLAVCYGPDSGVGVYDDDEWMVNPFGVAERYSGRLYSVAMDYFDFQGQKAGSWDLLVGAKSSASSGDDFFVRLPGGRLDAGDAPDSELHCSVRASEIVSSVVTTEGLDSGLCPAEGSSMSADRSAQLRMQTSSPSSVRDLLSDAALHSGSAITVSDSDALDMDSLLWKNHRRLYETAMGEVRDWALELGDGSIVLDSERPVQVRNNRTCVRRFVFKFNQDHGLGGLSRAVTVEWDERNARIKSSDKEVEAYLNASSLNLKEGFRVANTYYKTNRVNERVIELPWAHDEEIPYSEAWSTVQLGDPMATALRLIEKYVSWFLYEAWTVTVDVDMRYAVYSDDVAAPRRRLKLGHPVLYGTWFFTDAGGADSTRSVGFVTGISPDFYNGKATVELFFPIPPAVFSHLFDSVWDSGSGTIDKDKFKFEHSAFQYPFPYGENNGFADSGSEAIDLNEYKFTDGTFADFDSP